MSDPGLAKLVVSEAHTKYFHGLALVEAYAATFFTAAQRLWFETWGSLSHHHAFESLASCILQRSPCSTVRELCQNIAPSTDPHRKPTLRSLTVHHSRGDQIFKGCPWSTLCSGSHFSTPSCTQLNWELHLVALRKGSRNGVRE